MTAGVLHGSPRIAADRVDGGYYHAHGTAAEKDGNAAAVPGSYRVRLFDKRSGRLIRELWSASDGTYDFPYIAYRDKGYTIILYDHGANPKTAVTADFYTPDPMT